MTTKCHYCSKSYEWDSDNDEYIGAGTLTVQLAKVSDKAGMLTLFYCSCGAVLATMVDDKLGGQLYTPWLTRM